jgi:stress response protein YsnF
MPALDPQARERWRALVIVDRDAATVGTITAFYLDRVTGLPAWALVHTGWFGDTHTFVPLAAALEVDGEIRVPYAKTRIQHAPRLEPRGELSADDERVLCGHYGLDDHRGAVAEPLPDARGAGPDTSPPAAPATVAAVAQPGVDTPAQAASVTTHEGGVTVIRSEEQLRVGVRPGTRRVRLRKYVVTEYVTRMIAVRREEARLEEAATAGPGVDDAGPSDATGAAARAPAGQLELILHREEPVIGLRVVPYERVRVRKQVVAEERTITESLRKEQVEVDQDDSGR